MTRLLVVCCFSLLLAGVSGDDVTVTVMKGDDITLPINPEEIKKAERLLWKFNNINIATFDLENKSSLAQYLDDRFRGRLNLDRNTGSLTISNIRTEDTGVYQLEIRSSENPKYKTFSVTVSDEPSTFSVIKGDTVTLPTDVEIRPHDVQWKFKGTIIADLTGSSIPNMDVNRQTGELNITNIKPNQSGEYDVKINARDFILHRIFNVVNEVKSVSVMEGGSVSLNTEAKTQPDDVIEWKFKKNTLIAKLDRTEHPHPEHVLDERFRGRLHVDVDGSLVIRNIETKDTGLYDVNINATNRFIQKRFSLTVTESTSRSHQVKIDPGLFVAVIMLVTALVMPVTGDIQKIKTEATIIRDPTATQEITTI